MKLRAVVRNITVEPAIFFYFLAIFLLFSVFQPTVFNRVCTTYLYEVNSSTLPSSSCHDIYTLNTVEANNAIDHINRETNYWIKVSTLANAIPSILVDCFMGGWSDLFGRKMPMYLPSVGGVLGSCVYIAFVSIDTMDVAWLCLASFLTGIFGGVTSVIANCFSYVAALTDQQSRTLRVSFVDGMLFVAATFGPFVSKALKEALGPVYVYAANLLCHLAVVIYCFFLKEPNPRTDKKITCSKLFSPQHVIDSFKTVFAQRPKKGRLILLLQLLALFITMNVTTGESDILYIFMANISVAQNFEYFFGFKNFMYAFALLGLLPILKMYLKIPDIYICIMGLLSYIAGMLILALSSSVSLVFISGAVGMGAKIVDSVLRSLVSQNVNEEEIGKLYGFVAVMGDTSLILGALMFNSMFTPLSLLSGFPGMAYVVGSIILVIPTVILISILILRRVESNTTSNIVNPKNVYNNESFQY